VSAYRPSAVGPLTLSLGQWTAAGGPDLQATLEVDPRVFNWLVNKAAARSSGVYEVGLGTPPLKLNVEE
jgi:hypothetical protein